MLAHLYLYKLECNWTYLFLNFSLFSSSKLFNSKLFFSLSSTGIICRNSECQNKDKWSDLIVCQIEEDKMSGIFGKKHKSRKVPTPTIPTQPESHHNHEEAEPAEQAAVNVNNAKNGKNGLSEPKER